MRQNLLKYDQPIPLSEAEDKLKKAKSALTTSNASLEDILNAILPPIADQNKVQFVNKEAVDTLQIIQLSTQLTEQLSYRHAKEFGFCPILVNVYNELFNELIRQITIECTERGLLLKQLQDEIVQETKQKQVLYEQAIKYAQQKQQIQSNQETIGKISQLEKENIQLKKQAAEMKNQVEIIEKQQQENKEKDKKRFDDEKVFLVKFVDQLKNQLKQFLSEQ